VVEQADATVSDTDTRLLDRDIEVFEPSTSMIAFQCNVDSPSLTQCGVAFENLQSPPLVLPVGTDSRSLRRRRLLETNFTIRITKVRIRVVTSIGLESNCQAFQFII
jgi:hypothetical protein